MMSDCIFCQIAQRKIPSKICAESASVVAFHDIHPQAPVHLLIIPKEHISSVLELKKSHGEILAEMIELAQKCAESEGVKKSGFRLIFNSGPDAGQAVDHLHLHLLGKRRLLWPPG